eukprot:1708433-Rhodomonas_salina.2
MAQEGWLKGVLEKVAQDHRLSGDERVASAHQPLLSTRVDLALGQKTDVGCGRGFVRGCVR